MPYRFWHSGPTCSSPSGTCTGEPANFSHRKYDETGQRSVDLHLEPAQVGYMYKTYNIIALHMQ